MNNSNFLRQKQGSYSVKKTTVATFLIFLLFIADAFVAILGKTPTGFYRVSLFPRMIVELIAIVFLLTKINRTIVKESLTAILILTILFLTGIGWFTVLGNDFNFIETIIAFNKYIFFFILFPAMYILYENRASALSALFKTYESIICINSAAIIAGFLFKIDIFSSYGDYRFGYKGLIYAVNEASVFYVIALFYSLYEFHRKNRIVLLMIVMISNFLLGTKVGFILPLLVLGNYWLLFRISSKKAVFAISGIILCLVYFLPRFDLLSFLNRYKIFEWFAYSYEKSGFWTMFLSGRDFYIKDRLLPALTDRHFINWLFGGTNIAVTAIEMDFLDLFLFFGFIGSLIYLTVYIVFMFVKKNISFSLFVMFYYFLIAAFAGHFFYSAVNAAYLSILILKIRASPDLK